MPTSGKITLLSKCVGMLEIREIVQAHRQTISKYKNLILRNLNDVAFALLNI